MPVADLRELSADAVADIDLHNDRTMLVQPFLGDGFTRGGLHVAYDRRLYPVLARVLRTRACLDVRPGDVVHYEPLAYTEVDLIDGRRLYFMDERAVTCVLEGYDEHAELITP